MKKIRTYVLSVTTTGAAGSATGSAAQNGVNGKLLGLYFDFDASAPVTTDTTVTLSNPTRTILTLTDTVTDAYHAVRVQGSGTTGAALAGVYDVFPVDGTLTVNVAQSNALTGAVTVYAYVEEH